MDRDASVQDRMQGLFRGMTLGQMLSIGVSVVLVGLLFFLIFRWSTRPDYAILFSNLELKDADRIVETLSAQGTPYKLSAGGTAVLVPSQDVSEWRMKLASQGLPASGVVGYEIFDKNDIGISDFVQQVNYIRALEGELARTIMGIGSIRHARVHIVVPKDRLFLEDRREPTASIVLNIQGSARLSERQIHGITNLVAASVEGMTPDNVTIVDSRGNILSKPWEEDSILGLSSSQLELQRKVEHYLTTKAETMLGSVLGEGKAIVRVSAELNFQRIERTDERYDPDNAAVLSEELSGESSVDSAGNPAGQVEHTITNYQVPRTVEHVTNSVGNITKLSVAVLVDGKREKQVDESGGTTWEYTPRTEEEMGVLSAIVKNAVGFDALRNDQFEIRNIPFDHSDYVEEPVETSIFTQKEFLFSVGQKAVPVLFMVILLLILRSKFRKMKVSLPPVAAGETGSGVAGNAMLPGVGQAASRETLANANLLKQISAFAEEKPALAAKLIRYWMIEE